MRPGKVVELDLGIARGWLVIDFFIMGISWGGVRIASDVTRAETEMLARLMTLKSSLAGIPVGGAKTGIAADPETVNKKTLIQKFVEKTRELLVEGSYIPGSDMGFSEEDVQYLYSFLGGVRRPTLHSGQTIPSRTGLAVAESLHASIETLKHIKQLIDVETVALQGFGNMGTAAAYLLSSRGYRIVAVSNKYHTLLNHKGLDIDQLLDMRAEHGEKCLNIYAEKNPGSRLLPPTNITNIEADIFVPGARPKTITEPIPCRIVAPIANYSISTTTARILEHKGINIIPDIISTAGGVIASALSLLDRSFEDSRKTIAKITHYNMEKVVALAQRKNTTALEEAYNMAWRRVKWLHLTGPHAMVDYIKTWAAVGEKNVLTRVSKFMKLWAATS